MEIDFRVINNHLVFPVANPAKVQAAFPAIKVAKVGEQAIAAVKHNLEAVKFFANQGVHAPLPYAWPGRFTPYKHQIATTEFFVLNKRAFCLSGMGCISGDAIISTNRRGGTRKMTLRTLYHKWKNPYVQKRHKHKFSDGTGREAWMCRSLLGDRFGLNRIKDVVFRGYQPTLRITLADGKRITCTADHRMARPDGSWMEAGALQIGDLLVANGEKIYPDVGVPCIRCGAVREVTYTSQYRARATQCKKCYTETQKTYRGAQIPFWKGGKPYIDKDGYVRVYVPDHPRRQKTTGRVYEHILVAEKHFGIPITKDIVVHHKNGIKTDNRPENLELTTAEEHARGHKPVYNLDGGKTRNGGVLYVVPKHVEIVSIEAGGIMDVYDIEMTAPHHNFVADGIVVHNSGKTASALWATDFLMNQQEIQKTLIVAPLSTLDRVWAQEIFQVLPHRRCHILHGSRAKRLELLGDERVDFYVINHDGVEIIAEVLAKRPDINHVIVDELAGYRSHRTRKHRVLHAIINKQGISRSAWGLTGTPTPNAPTDCYGQIRLIRPEACAASFRAIQNELMFQVSQFRWLPRSGAENKVYKMMQPLIRYALEDCIDLPPTIYQERECELTAEQKRHYNEMRQKAFTEVRGETITAANAAVVLGKLLQASLFGLYREGGAVEFDIGPRLKVLREVIEGCNEKVIVFVPFTRALTRFHDELKNDWAVAVVDGSVSSAKRNSIFKAFQENKDPHILLAHPETMAHGLTLTAATTIIWAAPVTSTEIFLQANARIARPGQKKVTNIVALHGSPVERRLYQTLKDRRSLQDLVLQLAREG